MITKQPFHYCEGGLMVIGGCLQGVCAYKVQMWAWW